MYDMNTPPPLCLFANQEFLRDYGARVRSVCGRYGIAVDFVPAPTGDSHLDEGQLQAITAATFNGYWEADPRFTRRFFGILLRAPRLRWLHVPNAGVDHPIFGTLRQRGVVLTTSSGASAVPVAQSVMAAVLAFARGLPQWMAAQREKVWRPLGEQRPDLEGQTMAVVGLGAIGREVARLARALGLRVVAVRSAPRPAPEADEVVPVSALDALLPRIDWLVLTCPLTPQTTGLIDATRLRRLPAHARLVNVSRGAVIDEAALVEALRQGRVAGAYLDVFVDEPLPSDSPLWDLPNVILSPHDAAGASGNRRRVSELFLDNLERWAAGKPLRNVVT